MLLDNAALFIKVYFENIIDWKAGKGQVNRCSSKMISAHQKNLLKSATPLRVFCYRNFYSVSQSFQNSVFFIYLKLGGPDALFKLADSGDWRKSSFCKHQNSMKKNLRYMSDVTILMVCFHYIVENVSYASEH